MHALKHKQVPYAFLPPDVPLTISTPRFYWSASWPMTVLTLAVAVLFVRLGVWQWHRAQFKSAQLAQFDAGSTVSTELEGREIRSLPRYSVIRVHGHYDPVHQFLLDNLSHQGRPGYQVLTPLRLEDGRVLLVNRGWLPYTGRRSQLPDVGFTPEASAMTVIGRLDDLPVVGIALGHIPPLSDADWPKLTSFPTMTDLSDALHQPLEPRQLLLDPAAPAGLVRDWQLAGLGPTRHLSYAVQWWAFAALAVGLYGFLNRRQRA